MTRGARHSVDHAFYILWGGGVTLAIHTFRQTDRSVGSPDGKAPTVRLKQYHSRLTPFDFLLWRLLDDGFDDDGVSRDAEADFVVGEGHAVGVIRIVVVGRSGVEAKCVLDQLRE